MPAIFRAGKAGASVTVVSLDAASLGQDRGIGPAAGGPFLGAGCSWIVAIGRPVQSCRASAAVVVRAHGWTGYGAAGAESARFEVPAGRAGVCGSGGGT